MEEVVVKLNNFEGPFDLLLNLIEKNKMKISDINISQLIDEYLEVLKVSKRENIEIKSDFIIIASELIEIKTLNLLNLDKDKEKETNLRRRLEEHKLFKEVVPKVAKLENRDKILQETSNQLVNLKIDLMVRYRKEVEKKPFTESVKETGATALAGVVIYYTAPVWIAFTVIYTALFIPAVLIGGR